MSKKEKNNEPSKEVLQEQMKKITIDLISMLEDPCQRAEISDELVEGFKKEMGLKNNDALARYLLGLTRMQSILFTRAFERDILQIKNMVKDLQKMIDTIVD